MILTRSDRWRQCKGSSDKVTGNWLTVLVFGFENLEYFLPAVSSDLPAAGTRGVGVVFLKGTANYHIACHPIPIREKSDKFWQHAIAAHFLKNALALRVPVKHDHDIDFYDSSTHQYPSGMIEQASLSLHQPRKPYDTRLRTTGRAAFGKGALGPLVYISYPTNLGLIQLPKRIRGLR